MEARLTPYADVRPGQQPDKTGACPPGSFRQQPGETLKIEAWPGRGSGSEASQRAESFGSPGAYSMTSGVGPRMDDREQHGRYGNVFAQDEQPDNVKREQNRDEEQHQPAWAVSNLIQ